MGELEGVNARLEARRAVSGLVAEPRKMLEKLRRGGDLTRYFLARSNREWTDKGHFSDSRLELAERVALLEIEKAYTALKVL